ncbi:MAG: NAD(P)-dependent oxidoreductase [Dysgonamonadaceae bacterium]|nr:NAD(P)-dependent oxidoreductase [Dysgonamonadaceae bacterium]MDD3308635.1 NAD(P)-dependent oxidoreductase [Dysgonamonadaceae bacterium]MDD3901279.1 NAD(P)-dependent oxidoreductase [Dysgonamonadaceae bacterium]MDD4398258.1 NAD(P)-dependent oxidoreductase [Dysgonamonadaceae bacterium]
MKVLLATDKPFAAQAVRDIKSIIVGAGYEFVLLERYTNKQELLQVVNDVDALIIRSDIVDKEVIVAAPKLKTVVRAGSGYDNIDLEAASLRGVCVMNTPGQNSNAVAELVFGLLLNSQRNQFDGSIGYELKDKKLGVYAFGNVGRNVARIAQGFGMTCYAYSRKLLDEPKNEAEYGVIPVKSIEDLFEKSEIVSLHMPLTNDTRRCVNYNLLSRMPDNGILINSARQEIVVEEDILRVMEEKANFKYLTDLKPEKNEEFASRFGKRYFTTPKKAGAQTIEANNNAGLAAANQVVAYLKDEIDTFRVN